MIPTATAKGGVLDEAAEQAGWSQNWNRHWNEAWGGAFQAGYTHAFDAERGKQEELLRCLFGPGGGPGTAAPGW